MVIIPFPVLCVCRNLLKRAQMIKENKFGKLYKSNRLNKSINLKNKGIE